MAAACRAYSLAVRNSFADDVAGLVRHPDRSLAKAVSVTSVGRNASVLVWARLLMDCHLQDSVRHHSSADAPGHARGGAVDIARSRSW
jgi:hypothetical protein